MKLHRVIINWTHSAIRGQAVTVLHFDGSEQAAPPLAAVRTAFFNAKSAFPGGLTLSFPNTGDSIEDTTGALAGVWTTTAQADVVGASGTLTAAAGVGACIGWNTGGIVTGTKGPRKVRGRTFLVPLSAAAYQEDGTISPTVLPWLQTLASDLQAAGGLAVWHRPTTAGAADGNSYGVISNRVRDKVAILTSRRD